MFRRIVSTCVLIGFIAGQWAAVPHAHAHETDADHGHSSPHLHLSWFGGSTHEHGHVHGPGGVHHHHAAASNDDAAKVPKGHEAGGDDHDQDAVYLPGEALQTGSSSLNQAVTLKWQAAQLALLAFDSVLVADLSLNRCTPDKVQPGCALYLVLRTLRI